MSSKDDYTFEDHGKVFVYIFDLLNYFWIFGTLIYYGLFKKDFRIKKDIERQLDVRMQKNE